MSDITSHGKDLKFMKPSGSRSEIKEFMEIDKAYTRMDRKAARALRECANISLDIDSNQEVIDVCKAWSDAQKDAARNASILSAIDAWREVEIPEAEIKKKIIAKYNLTEEEATEFMLKKSA